MDNKNIISVKTGQKEYVLKTDRGTEISIWLNPTDTTFVDKIFTLFEEFQEKEEELKEELSSAEPKDVFETGRRIDAEMRGKFLDVFGQDIVTPLVGNMSVYALAQAYKVKDEKFPIWANILLALIDVLSDELTAEQKKSAERVKKYTNKYRK